MPETREHCPHCWAPIQPEWMACPHCHHERADRCKGCGRSIPWTAKGRAAQPSEGEMLDG